MNNISANNQKSCVVIFVILAVVAALFYSIFTQEAWEDFFITFKFSKNLIDGHGLVYDPDQRIHGFTSPLGVLLPALCYLIMGKGSYYSALWLFRIFSLAAYVGSYFILARSFVLRNFKSYLPLVFFSILYIFEIKMLSFSMNGMETAFMLLFLAWLVSLFDNNFTQRWLAGGLSWAGLMWTRPDGIIYILAVAASTFLLGNFSRRKLIIAFLKMGITCAIVYLPWFLWTWFYYGTPIPHTIMAKAVFMQGDFKYLLQMWILVIRNLFAPVYYVSSQWPGWIQPLYFSFGLFASFYWIFRTKDKDILGRTVSFIVFLMSLYLTITQIYPWYLPPVTMLALYVVIQAVFCGMEYLKKNDYVNRMVVYSLLLMFAGVFFYIFCFSMIQSRVHQIVVEDGNRKQVGLWLKEHVAEDERVYLEPVGYIGYFSEAKMLDFPGLVSPDVVRAIQENDGLNFYTLITVLEPEWIVVRPFEALEMQRQTIMKITYVSDGSSFHERVENYLDTHYSLVKTFSVADDILNYPFMAEQYDGEFMIFRKIH